MSSWINRTVLSGSSVNQNGTNSHTCTFTPAGSGNLLVAVVAGGVTFTTPSGWTLVQSAVGNSGLYVFRKAASSGESSFTTTHNGSNYPIEGIVYEFYAGSASVGTPGTATGVAGTYSGAACTGLSGTYTRFAVRSWNMGTNPADTASCAWTLPSVEDYDAYTTVSGGAGNIELSVAYDDGATGSSFTPSSVMSVSSGGNGEIVSFALSIVAPSAGTPPIPTLAGYTSSNGAGNSTSFTVDPTAQIVTGRANTGDWIILVGTSASGAANTKTPGPPGDWTTLVPFATVGSGTMSFGLWAHRKLAGETTYTWSLNNSLANGFNYRLVFVRGGSDIANWVQGAFDYRANTGTTTTNVAASITTTIDNSLALLISCERTVAAETSNQVTCTNFTKQTFENDDDQSIFLATKDMTTAGSTSSSTVTYPNTHASNGIAGILGIPPYENMAGIMWTT